MNLLETTSLSTEDKVAILDLWNAEYPEKVTYKTMADFENYLSGLAEGHHFLLKDDQGGIRGWACRFLRDGERWFVIILHHSLQGQGQGTFLLDRLKEGEEQLNGWVVDHDRDVKSNGEPYRSPLLFYLKNGFVFCPGIRLELEVLSAAKVRWLRQ